MGVPVIGKGPIGMSVSVFLACRMVVGPNKANWLFNIFRFNVKFAVNRMTVYLQASGVG